MILAVWFNAQEYPFAWMFMYAAKETTLSLAFSFWHSRKSLANLFQILVHIERDDFCSCLQKWSLASFITQHFCVALRFCPAGSQALRETYTWLVTQQVAEGMHAGKVYIFSFLSYTVSQPHPHYWYMTTCLFVQETNNSNYIIVKFHYI